ncbi:MAG TPA: BTAD domain-containing putative transcriptional regulator [Actinocrinis sp.]|jgi:DNA-binding SARP family transcriptional activator/Tfp pilus assembly protein PilF
MRFALLGHLEVRTETGPTEIPGTVRRTLLAALLLHADSVVSADRLAQYLWDGRQPTSATASLYNQVMRLRHNLGGYGDRIKALTPGYLIRLEPGELDVQQFEQRCSDGRRALLEERWEQASQQCAAALELWRGEPLADVPSTSLRDAWLPRLEQLRAQALEWRIEADLHRGLGGELVLELTGLVRELPLRERFRAQLVLALARAGRQAEALTAYQDARRVLIDELGIEPGPELQQLQQRVLAGDAELLEPSRPAVGGGAAPVHTAVVPRQLPTAAGHFVGRKAELKTLNALLSQRDDAGGAVVISAIDGTAGIGKTALAVRWAHQVAPLFPDGQLYLDLRGFDPSRAPMEPAEAVRRLLQALGVPAQTLPADPEDQAALYRSHLADLRMLILLDNARDAGQVRPLLPGAAGCLVVVTSRNQLGGLVAREGAVPLTLDLLGRPDARDLLIRRLGGERVLSDERTAGELIELCARLPLALNIAAARAALQPARPLSELADELRDSRGRLDGLALGDATADVRAVFSWSYRGIDPPAARVFRLLGLHTGPDIGVEAAASLAALDPGAARRALDEPARAHLLTEYSRGRYSFHDLLRAYAADQAEAHESESEREQALRRMCDFYLHTTHAADRLMAPDRPLVALDPPEPGALPHPLPDAPAAIAWLDAEYPNVLAARHTAVARAWHPVVWQLAWSLTTYFRRRGLTHDQLAAWQAAADSAAYLPDPTSRIRAFLHLGRSFAEAGRHEEAIRNLEQALAFAELHGDAADQAHTHFAIERTWDLAGDHRQAMHHAGRALSLCRGLERPVWEADALNMMGWHAAHLGDYDTARTHCEAALALIDEDQDPDSRAGYLDSLGYIEHHTGNHDLAIERYRQAIDLYRTAGSTHDCANSLASLGAPYAALGRHEQAHAAWRQALDLYRDLGFAEDAERVRRRLETAGA